ncbi:MAG: hypothetical protein M1829_003801 [Trizodia sp. TS-e1964]|nr:MAG: hypothetical protein M1829_003801 [Trizodia sp. TS-e1964]
MAIPWPGPAPTPMGLMGNGISVLPTDLPKAPKGLLKRNTVIPAAWCGFIGGDTLNVLSCAATKSCVYSGTAVGCCSGDIGACPDIYTACQAFGANCDFNCQANQKILKCTDSKVPFCAAYTFSSGYVNYDCTIQSGILTSVDFITDILPAASGANGPVVIAGSYKPSGTGTGASVGVIGTAAGSKGQATGIQTSSASATTLSIGAVVGIVVGSIFVIGGLLAGFITFCCLKRRKVRSQEKLESNKTMTAEGPRSELRDPNSLPSPRPIFEAVPHDHPGAYYANPSPQYTSDGQNTAFFATPEAEDGHNTNILPQYSEHQHQNMHHSPTDSKERLVRRGPAEVEGTPVDGPYRMASPVPSSAISQTSASNSPLGPFNSPIGTSVSPVGSGNSASNSPIGPPYSAVSPTNGTQRSPSALRRAYHRTQASHIYEMGDGAEF